MNLHDYNSLKWYSIFFLVITIILFLCLWVGADEIDMSIIATIESNNDPMAYNAKSKARGMYQITPICLKDYNIENLLNLPLVALFDPKTSIDIANWYLNARIPQFLRNKGIVDTIDNRLWAYNAGIGNVVKGIMPQETVDYIRKYKELANETNF